MFIRRIAIKNFKSLKNVVIEPSGLTTLIGPNNAGKSNFVAAMKFLSDVYRHGLEPAIATAGGMENILFRRQRRSLSPLAVAIEATFEIGSGEDDLMSIQYTREGSSFRASRIRVSHEFSVKTRGPGIRADFHVAKEILAVHASIIGKQQESAPEELIYRIERDADGETVNQSRMETSKFHWNSGNEESVHLGRSLPSGNWGKRDRQSLLFPSPHHFDPAARLFCEALSRVSVFHPSPGGSRLPATPTPNPSLSMHGEDLPALVDWMKRKHPKRWEMVLDAMRWVVTGLEDIATEVMPTKTLGLVFIEEGFGRAWRADEVSDGTLCFLSIAAAAADPRTSVLVIDEPESSLHPWMIHTLGETLRALAKQKTAICTTQSPVLIDMLYPGELWVVSRGKGQTRIKRLTDLDRRLEKDWLEGKVTLSEYLGTGLIPQAVPGGQ